MTWTTPRTWTNGEVPGATEMNTHIRDNLNALKSPPEGGQVILSGTYTTSSTSWADVDATNFASTLTPAGAKVRVVAMVTCKISSEAYTGYFTVSINGSDAAPTHGVMRTQHGKELTLTMILDQGATAGASNTYKLRYKVSDGAATLTVSQVVWNVKEAP